MKKLFISGLTVLFLLSCGNLQEDRKAVSTLKTEEVSEVLPKADIDELEMEINNGGFNQYFINSSSLNSFETLRLLEKTGKINTANLMKKAFALINPKKLDESTFLEKLRKREVEELYDKSINEKLSVLDQEFYKYPDGSLK